MNKAIIYFVIGVLLFTVSACSSTKSVNNSSKTSAQLAILSLNEQLFADVLIPETNQENPFKLTESQQKIILSAVSKKQQQGFKLHKALYDVLQNGLTNFTYYGETYNAETAMRLNKGNCMSLAILTTAYAKLLGLDFSYREVNTLPVFKKQNNLIISSSHVQTIIYEAELTIKPSSSLLGKSGLVIDYFPSKDNRGGKYFNENSFISMYYKNLAGDALVDKDLIKAFRLAKKSYQYDKNNVEAINTLAIIHRRAGDIKGAEAIYQAGLSIDQKNLRLVSNYIMLLKKQNRMKEAKKYQQQLDKLDDPNPFHWLEEAYIAEKNNEINKATRYYLKALNRAPYLHQAYQGLYHIYRDKGHYAKAKSMLKKALEWTYEREQRKQYKYKLYSLAKL